MVHRARSSVVDRMCIQCDAPDCQAWGPTKRCARCMRNYYCSRACQVADWKEHKTYCKEPPKTKYEKLVSAEEDNEELMLNALGGILASTEDGDSDEAINTECPICFASPPNNPVVLSACRHCFCYNCLIEWQKHAAVEAALHQNTIIGSKSGTPCPYCKSTETEDVEEELLEKVDFLLSIVKMPITGEKEREALRKQALRCVDKVLRAENAKMEAYVTKAKILLALGRHSEAIRAADEAMDENEKREAHPLIVLCGAAKAALVRGDMAEYYSKIEAIGEQKADFPSTPLSLLSNYAECRLIKCEALEAQNDLQGALDLYRDVTSELKLQDGEEDSKLHEMTCKSMVGIARCNYGLDKLERAITMSESAIESYRHRPNVHKYKALSLQKLGKLDEAITVMQQAVLYETPWNLDDTHNAQVWQLYKELCAERDAQQNS